MPSKASLFEALERTMGRVQAELHVCLPGRVERYDASQQRADVVPLLRDRYADGQVTEAQVISNVPVVFPRAGGGYLTMPVQRGDGVMLHFADRSLDEWLSSGGTVTPTDPRAHDLSDCIAVPGLVSFDEGEADPDNTVVGQGRGRLVLNPDNRMALGNDSEELLQLLDELMVAVANGICSSGSFLSTRSDIQSIQSRLQSIKGSL